MECVDSCRSLNFLWPFYEASAKLQLGWINVLVHQAEFSLLSSFFYALMFSQTTLLCPLTFLGRNLELFYIHLKVIFSLWLHKARIIFVLLLCAAGTYICHVPGIHQIYIQSWKVKSLRCLYWIGLGILSSIGLGTGLHTFILYLVSFPSSSVSCNGELCKEILKSFPIFNLLSRTS